MPPDGPFHINTGSADAILEHLAARVGGLNACFSEQHDAWFVEGQIKGVAGKTRAKAPDLVSACQLLLRASQMGPERANFRPA